GAACSSNRTPGFTEAPEAGPPVLVDSGPSAVCTTDCDHDGYDAPADCDDFDATVNPEAYDFPGDAIDNDCDGQADDPVDTCETVPTSTPGTPADFARAADLCAQRSITHTGAVFDPLIRAEWGQVKGPGGAQVFTSQTKPQQVNIVSSFGQNAVRQGKTMFGLSNGPWGATDPRSSPALDPAGFKLDDACADIPLTGLDCAGLSGNTATAKLSVQDWAELTLWVKVPSNAHAMHFDFAFFSSEFNQWWNAAANDAFFVLVSSASLSGVNVAKDAHGLAITVNSGFFQLCPAPPGPAGLSQSKAAGLQQCVGPAGDAAQGILGALAGTGYDGAAVGSNDTATAVDGSEYVYGGGSGWLTGSFGVTPGEELQMRIVVMDTFDGLKDSTVLVDKLGWEPGPPAGVVRPPH
ncbi:MAG TPA: putative metal-binding motif-containing protein, partial [Polyangiaceae bacterium]